MFNLANRVRSSVIAMSNPTEIRTTDWVLYAFDWINLMEMYCFFFQVLKIFKISPRTAVQKLAGGFPAIKRLKCFFDDEIG